MTAPSPVGVRTQVNNAIRDRRNRSDFEKAKKEAAAAGGRLCGTYAPDGKPVYFVVPADADDSAIERRAFEAREGRQITKGELMLLGQAKARMART